MTRGRFRSERPTVVRYAAWRPADRGDPHPRDFRDGNALGHRGGDFFLADDRLPLRQDAALDLRRQPFQFRELHSSEIPCGRQTTLRG
jgi:hypothetical protein